MSQKQPLKNGDYKITINKNKNDISIKGIIYMALTISVFCVLRIKLQKGCDLDNNYILLNSQNSKLIHSLVCSMWLLEVTRNKRKTCYATTEINKACINIVRYTYDIPSTGFQLSKSKQSFNKKSALNNYTAGSQH